MTRSCTCPLCSGTAAGRTLPELAVLLRQPKPAAHFIDNIFERVALEFPAEAPAAEAAIRRAIDLGWHGRHEIGALAEGRSLSA